MFFTRAIKDPFMRTASYEVMKVCLCAWADVDDTQFDFQGLAQGALLLFVQVCSVAIGWVNRIQSLIIYKFQIWRQVRFFLFCVFVLIILLLQIWVHNLSLKDLYVQTPALRG